MIVILIGFLDIHTIYGWWRQVQSGLSTGLVIIAETGCCGVCVQPRWIQRQALYPTLFGRYCLHVSINGNIIFEDFHISEYGLILISNLDAYMC